MENEKGLKFLRFLLLLSSISPVFILLAIKGSNFSDENMNKYFIVALFCLICVSIIPMVVCYIKLKNEKEKTILKSIQNKIELCSGEYSAYIISIALPLCQNDLTNVHQLCFLIAMFIFIVFLFYVFNLYYLNIFFYLFNYKLYKIKNERETFILISKKSSKDIENKSIQTKKITNSLFMEIGING